MVDAAEADADAVLALVSASDADVVLAGAGCYNTLEHDARLAARTLSIPCVAVLDYWFEYSARFHRRGAGGAVASWPDLVCAPDETAAAELIEAGCRRHSVAVTGPPNIEDSLSWWATHATLDRQSLACHFQVPAERPLVVFFSEPYHARPDGRKLMGPGGLYHDDGRPLFGYTATQMLDQTLDALDRAVRQSGCVPPHVVVKAHPLEWAAPLRRRQREGSVSRVGVTVVEEGDPKELVALADAVVGMSSITLLEAALVGRPTFSVQIGDGTAPFDPCVANRLGLANHVRSRKDLDEAAIAIVGGCAANPPRGADRLHVTGAAARVADAIARVPTLKIC